MTQEKANSIFESGLGLQIDKIHVTSDDRVFIRYEEAVKHTNGDLDKDTMSLIDKTITVWYQDEII